MKKNAQKFAYIKMNSYLCTEIVDNMNKNTKKTLIRAIVAGAIAFLGVIAAAVGLQSCNVTRVITNESSYLQRGDTAVMIHTKTIETYDASKK